MTPREVFTQPSEKREPVPAAVLEVLRESDAPSPQRVAARFANSVRGGFRRA